MSTERELARLIQQKQKELNRIKLAKGESLSKSELTARSKVHLRIDSYCRMMERTKYDRLKQIYANVFKVKAPPATEEWLKEVLAREEQRRAYLDLEGKVPDKVLDNDKAFNSRQVPLILNDLREQIKRMEQSVYANVKGVTY